MPQMVIDPGQIPALIEQNKAQLTALEEVIKNKRDCMGLLDVMEAAVAENNLVAAFSAFIAVQKVEYGTVIKSLEERQHQIRDMLRQLESPLSIPMMQGPVKPPFSPPRRS